MKRALSMLLCIALLVSITGCKNTEEEQTTTTTTQSNVTVTESTTEPETVEEVTESTTEHTEESTKPKSEETTSDQNADSKETTTVKNSKLTNTTTTKPQETEIETTKPVQHATKADEKAVADRLIYYINKYRQEEGNVTATKLSGLTEYAEYRSRQLVSNPTHDTDDERAAATALKYGEYVDPSLYGMSGEPYYTANAGEAIAGHGYRGTVDDIAKQFANQFRNSPGHWRYVGAVDYASSYYKSEYKYIAVGITYENGYWYCCVCVTDTNQYG